MPLRSSVTRPDPRPDARPGAVVLGRRTLAGLAGLGAVALVWAGGTTFYIAFRDEFAQSFVARQTELRYLYEDRIAELKGRLEREVTANLVERNGFSARTEALASRQSEIEARQLWLGQLTERLGGGPGAAPGAGTGPTSASGSLRAALPPTVAPAEPVAPSGTKPQPLPADGLDLRLRKPGDEASRELRPAERLAGMEAALRRVSDTAVGSADAVRRTARDRAGRLRLALEATRIDTARLLGRAVPMGGPLVALPAAFDAGAFAPIAADAEAALVEVEALAAAVRGLPLGRPLAGDLDATSSFGYRVDPFTRAPALHTGLDLRAEPGAAVRATAFGRVLSAEATGGYGNMVEIEHEGGVATRYAHLASIAVLPGQRVEAGQLVGRAGSTGRSTGAHLHYETRVDGEPVNPTRFLQAGRLLGPMP